MNTNQPPLTLILCVLLIVIAALACSRTESPEDAPPVENTPATPSQAAASDINGDYIVAGTNPNASKYEGSLNITRRDQVYQFSWTSGERKYDGVGVRTDNTVAVAFTEGSDGKGCGVVLYKVGADGSLDGRSGYWGVNSSETEKGVRTSGSDLAGIYDVTGTNPGGKDYKGKLAVNKHGRGYRFDWDVGGRTLSGYGVQSGDMASAGFGGPQCGFVSYEIMQDGTLSGQWGGSGSSEFGTEVARKR